MAEDNKDLKSEVSQKEEETLKFWQENKIFEKTVATPAGAEPVGEFVFYDGPPFATGKPHFGHLLPTSLKDAIPRYQTMKGKRVRRRWGWDCHGLPIENIVEKELGLTDKASVEEFGLAKFNEKAREMVLRYTYEWERIIPRMGRFVDMDNDYRTMDWSYTETTWWIFKELYDKGLIYEGYKAMHICPHCETPLSNFEVNQGYKDVTDISVTVKFALTDQLNTFLLAWTTTPWTLPGNVALAVGLEIEYSRVTYQGADYIVASDRLKEVFKEGDFSVVETFLGQALIGKAYSPAFDYFSSNEALENKENGWQVYGADFVSTEEGTGIVHIAPAFGSDDMELGKEKNLPFIQHVSMNGRFTPEVTDFAGQAVKPKADPQATDIEIIKYLAGKDLLFSKAKIVHSYPHCWRCDAPLLNYATTSWFVDVSSFRDKLVLANSEVNWIPDHIKDGRFGKWLAGARDWAISRTRFWGSPIPVWKCESCQEVKVFGSLADYAKHFPSSGNNFIFLRHGQSESNTNNIMSSAIENPHHLTELGQEQAKQAGLSLKEKNIDLIFASPLVRTKETAEIVVEQLGLTSEDIIFDERIKEVQAGDFNNRPIEEYRNYFTGIADKFDRPCPGGETLAQLKQRVGDFLFDIDKQYQGKNILIISHEYPIWLLASVAAGLNQTETVAIKEGHDDFVTTGEIKEVTLVTLPRNDKHELDFHRPYVDEATFPCQCGGSFKRIPEIFDCWFESGAMPYAQEHYPFSEGEDFDPKNGKGLPADFIAEGLDQTRGWFYSLLVLSVALFGKAPYKNVIVNGLILAEDGRKMSKRLNNYPDMNLTLDKYGADAHRFYLLSSPAVRSEDFNFSEKGLAEVYRKNILRLENVASFFYLYKTDDLVIPAELDLSNILDRWIVSRLSETQIEIETNMDKLMLDRALRPIETFIDDLSTWYLRRSRERFKSDNENDSRQATETTGYVLLQFAKILAPFVPFLSERLYLSLPIENKKESVHLEAWPTYLPVETEVIANMTLARNLVEEALALRQKSGLKVRQPLSSLTVKDQVLSGQVDVLEIVKDEINVKEILFDENLTDKLSLDTDLTEALRLEGLARDLIRQIQDQRKKLGLKPTDRVVVYVDTQDFGRQVIEEFNQIISEAVGADEVLLSTGLEAESSLELDDLSFGIKIEVL